jgi:dGTPase
VYHLRREAFPSGSARTRRMTDGTPATEASLVLDKAALERQEEERLSCLAMKSARARRLLPEPAEGRHFQHRTEYQRDRDRIIYSRSFRRLRQKTQVYLPYGGDHYRNRMTHTMEVSQISRTIARALQLNEDLVEAIVMGHDVGHSTFAHSGEKILNEILRGETRLDDLPGWKGEDLGGFKHNYQSIRVLDEIEKQYAFPGLNLTGDVREGIIKHTSMRRNITYPGLTEDGLNLGRPVFFEGQVTALADDIAQQIHDCDDGMRAGQVDLAEVENLAVSKEIFARAGSSLTSVSSRYVRRNLLFRAMTHLFVTNVILESGKKLTAWAEKNAVTSTDAFYERLDDLRNGVVTLSEEGKRLYADLREFVYRRIISSLTVSRGDARARMFVTGLFKAYYRDPRLLDDYVLLRFREKSGRPFLRDVSFSEMPKEIERYYWGEPIFIRLVCDHIAGMTDKYAVDEYDKIYSPHPRG